jgi:hypothetical protein
MIPGGSPAFYRMTAENHGKPTGTQMPKLDRAELRDYLNAISAM